jgi:hypothetical protein
MSTAQVNGINYTIPPNRPYSGANQNNGTMRANNVFSDVINSVTTARPIVETFASTVIEDTVTVVDYAGKVVEDGIFAFNNKRPISSLVTQELAGLTNTSISGLGNNRDTIRSINKFETDRTALLTSGFRAGKLSILTGKWSLGFPIGVNVSFDTDKAANPSASVPGQLTYRTGSKVPVNDNYKANTSY